MILTTMVIKCITIVFMVVAIITLLCASIMMILGIAQAISDWRDKDEKTEE